MFRVAYRRSTLNRLRLLVSIAVVIYHTQQILQGSPLLDAVFKRGWIFTDFFIVLSGFGIDQGYRVRLVARDISHPRFLYGRLRRIWPRYFVALLLAAAVISTAKAIGLAPGFHSTLTGWLKEAAMLSGTGLDTERWWNGPMWTVNCLMVCYGVYPLLARLPFIVPALAVAAASLCVERLYAWQDINHGLVRVAPLFLLGIVLSRFARADHRPASNQYLANISFAIYLTHYMWMPTVTDGISKYVHTPAQTIMATAAIVSSSVAFACWFEVAYVAVAKRLRPALSVQRRLLDPAPKQGSLSGAPLSLRG